MTKAIPIWPHDKSIIREEPSKSGKNGVPDQLGKKEVEIPASKSLAELELILEKNESAIRSKKQISEIIRELEKAERCEVFRLNPKLLINRVDGEIKVKKGSFHGYESQDLHGQTEKADQLKDITTFIGKSMHWSNLRKGACFNPRHGLRITVGKRTLEFVICFECWTIKVYEGENSLGSFAFLESKENPIEKLMKDAEEKPKSRP